VEATSLASMYHIWCKSVERWHNCKSHWLITDFSIRRSSANAIFKNQQKSAFWPFDRKRNN